VSANYSCCFYFKQIDWWGQSVFIIHINMKTQFIQNFKKTHASKFRRESTAINPSQLNTISTSVSAQQLQRRNTVETMEYSNNIATQIGGSRSSDNDTDNSASSSKQEPTKFPDHPPINIIAPEQLHLNKGRRQGRSPNRYAPDCPPEHRNERRGESPCTRQRIQDSRGGKKLVRHFPDRKNNKVMNFSSDSDCEYEEDKRRHVIVTGKLNFPDRHGGLSGRRRRSRSRRNTTA